MTQHASPRLKTATACILMLSLFALLCLARFDGIHGQDEISHYMKLTRMLFHDGYSHPEDIITFSPHLYPLGTWAVSSLLGDANSFTMRLAGLLFWLATLGATAAICRKSHPILALALCAFAPAVVSAVTIVEIDQAAMPAFALLLVWSVVSWLEAPGRRAACVVALAFCLCLWCRLSTPLALAPLAVAFAGFRSRSAKRALLLGGLLAAGFGLFVASWWLYGALTGVRWTGVFEYLARSFTETTVGSRSSGAVRLCVSGAAVVLWGMTPYFIVLLVLSCRAAARRLPADGLYGLAALWLLAAFTVVGGALFGFPKYQMAAFPLAAIALAKYGKDRWKALHRAAAARLALFACAAFAAAWFIIGDPIHALRIDLRDAALEGAGAAGILGDLAARLLAANAAILLAGFLARRTWRLDGTMLALAAGLCVNAALLARQSTAGYDCAYMYGDEGDTRAVAAFINDNGHDPSAALVPHEVLDVLGRRELTDAYPFLPTAPADLLGQLEARRPSVVAWSVLTSPPGTVRALRNDPQLRDFLRQRYDFRKIGRYDVFSRRAEQPVK